MKAVNDYRILMPNVPYYETGIAFNEYEIVYYTGINAGTYTDNTKTPPITETVINPVLGKTGYYYLKNEKYNVSGDNKFWTRPDSVLNGDSLSSWWVQNFFFIPTYGSSVQFNANYYENMFEDQYRYVLGKSENVIQVSATLSFQGVTDNEARALNHFYQNYFTKSGLANGQGMQPIEMSLFYPHDKVRPFYLKSINNDLENVDFNNITLEVESPFISLTSWKEKLISFKTSENNYYDTLQYSKHDYVFEYKSNNSSEGFFYCSGDSILGVSPYSDGVENLWTQKFYFSPDLIETLNFESSMYKNDLGNFYLNQSVGINPNFFDLQLSFNNRNDKEAKAILHFLENHNGLELFEYDMFPPYTGTRAFFCPEWNHTYNFADNHTIKARLIESKFNYIIDDQFDTALNPSGINFGFVPLGFSKKQIVKIKNNEYKPVTFTISSDIFDPNSVQNTDVNFVHQLDNESQIQTAKGGGYANYTIDCDLETSNEGIFASTYFKYTGAYQFVQEKENDGIIADNELKLNYSGEFYDYGETINTAFLSGLKNCVASPYYDFSINQLCLKTKFVIPQSGYYYNNFSGRLSTTSGSFVANQYTGSSKGVVLNNTNDLYEIGVPNETAFEMNFTGISFGVDYFLRVSGLNTNYLGLNSSPYVFASGVDRITDQITNQQVISGLTVNNLANFNINPPVIRLDGSVETFYIKNDRASYFDLYKFVETNARFGSAFSLYSGVKIYFDNSYYGPLIADSDLSVYNTGSFIITGNYSMMPSGVTLNFTKTNVIGKGGNVCDIKDIDNPVYSGKNAFYIHCSGIININKDYDSIFAAGGGAGDNIELGDVVKYESNKYTTLKDDFSTTSNVTQFNTLKLHFNKANTILNKDQTSAQGSSILYDFFDPTRKPIPYKVFGGAGGGLGKGTGINPITFIDDAQILKASNNYNLTSIVEFGKNQYPNPKG
jgi:phage-related protein